MFKTALLLMAGMQGLSLLAFLYPVLSIPLLVAVGLVAFWLSFKNMEWGVYLLLGELFWGSRGHFLEADVGFLSISLRLLIFLAVLSAWVVGRIRRGRMLERDSWRFPSLGYGLLLLAVLWGVVSGLSRGYDIGKFFLDANGYFYLAVLPVLLDTIKRKETIHNLMRILAAAVVVISLTTLLLFLWFTYDWPGVATIYHWVINRDIGEITGTVGSASRVFLPSQFYALLGLFVFGLTDKKNWYLLAAALLAVILSLSRSFWLGAAGGGVFVVLVAIGYLRIPYAVFLRLGLGLLLVASLEIGGLYFLSRLSGAGLSSSVASRLANPVQEAAGNARLLLLPELLAVIKDHPLLGSGFGKEVSYRSYLPDRITPANPQGKITSYAFEWGYLDTAVKIGLLGLLAYLLFIAEIFKRGWEQLKRTKPGLVLGLLGGLTSLAVLNLTTPYLNHPLGIGFLVLSSVTFSVFAREEAGP